MDSKKILEVISLYRQLLDNKSIKAVTYPHGKLLPIYRLRSHALAHCRAMIEKMEYFVIEGRMEKTFRWLGFVQGVLWVLRICTLEDLKNHNKPYPFNE